MVWRKDMIALHEGGLSREGRPCRSPNLSAQSRRKPICTG